MIKTIKKCLSGCLKLVPMRHSEPAKQVKNLNAMKNKILRLSLKMTDKLSGSLKNLRLLMILCLFAHTAYAQHDIAKSENYLPNGKYRLFGSGRGEVQNINNHIRLHGQLNQQAGNLSIETRLYQGDLSYQQHFHHHGHSVHAPFENKAQRNFSAKTGSVVQGGATLTDLSVTGYEIHPADAYDGEQGGGYPVPTGARDEYLYEVNGKEVSVKVVAWDKLPPKADDNQLLRQVGIVPERYNPPQPTDNRTPIERISFANAANGNAYGDFVDLTHNGQGWESVANPMPMTSWSSPVPERGAAYYSHPSITFVRIVPQASWVTKPYDPNETVKIAGFGTSTPTPKYNPYDYPTSLPLFDNPLHKGKGSSSAGNSGDDKQSDDNNPPVLGYYYDDDDEPLKLGYYDDDPIWESENNLIIYPSDNNCYGDCVIRLNDPTQQYGGQVIPVYQPSDKNFGILTRALNSNNPAAVETALLILVGSSVVTQQTADAIQSAANRGDFDGAKNILAQSQAAAGGAMPPDDGDGKNNSKRDKETEKKIDNILKDTKKGEKTSGKARQYEKAGDFETAKQDFKSLNPTNIQERDNGIITGKLPDGRNVIVRPSSRSEKPTLEIQNTPNNYTKIRYGD